MKKFFYLLLAALTLVACGDGNDPEQNVNYPEGAIHGLFSVSANKQIMFSQGNLRYIPAMGLYRFAEHQWEVIGTDNVSDGTLGGVIDLFGWGTGTNPTNVSMMNADYATFTDWGVKPITYAGNTANMWRTLTKDEWEYLFKTRDNAANLYKASTIEGNYGMVVLPDNWETPAIEDTYTKIQWADLEDAGAVFLPAAGSRYGTEVDEVGESCLYWSSSKNGENGAFAFQFASYGLDPNSAFWRYAGLAVRLVHDLKKEDITPDPNRPKAPTGVTVQIVESEQGNGWIDHFNLSWESVEGAKSYKVYRTLKKNGTSVYEENKVIATVTETNFHDNLFDPNDWGNKYMQFIYTVTAVSSNGSESDPSEEVSTVWEKGA